MGVRSALQNGRARTVPEQHAGVAIRPIHDGRKFLRPDHQNRIVGAGGDKLLADFQPTDIIPVPRSGTLRGSLLPVIYPIILVIFK